MLHNSFLAEHLRVTTSMTSINNHLQDKGLDLHSFLDNNNLVDIQLYYCISSQTDNNTLANIEKLYHSFHKVDNKTL